MKNEGIVSGKVTEEVYLYCRVAVENVGIVSGNQWPE